MTRRRNAERITDSEADNKLVTDYRSGDTYAEESLTERMTSVAYRFLLGKTQSQYLADELLQMAFLELDKALFKLNEPIDIKLDAFCRTITFRVLMSHYRRLYVEAKRKAESIVTGVNEPADKNLDGPWYDELEFLQTAIETLSERHRKIIELRYWDDLSVAEIAEELGVSERRVRQIIQRAMKHLQIELGNRNTPQPIDPRV